MSGAIPNGILIPTGILNLSKSENFSHLALQSKLSKSVVYASHACVLTVISEKIK